MQGHFAFINGDSINFIYHVHTSNNLSKSGVISIQMIGPRGLLYNEKFIR